MNPIEELCAELGLNAKTCALIGLAIEQYRRQLEDEKNGPKWNATMDRVAGIKAAAETLLDHLDNLGHWGKAAFHQAGLSLDIDPGESFSTPVHEAISHLVTLADPAQACLREKTDFEGQWETSQGAGSGIGRASVHWVFPAGDEILRKRQFRNAKDKLAVAVIAALSREDILKREEKWTGKADLERFLDRLSDAEKLGNLNWDKVTRDRCHVRMFAFRELIREWNWDRSFRRIHGYWPDDRSLRSPSSRFGEDGTALKNSISRPPPA